MVFLKNTNVVFRKIRKIGWKLTILIILVFFSAEPDCLEHIPFFYDAFLFSNNIYNYVMDLIYKVHEVFLVGDIVGFIGALLPFIAIYIVLLTLISFLGVPVTDLLINIITKNKEKTNSSEEKIQEKKMRKPRTESEPHVFGTTKLISVLDKIKKQVKLNELKKESQFVFFNNNETYLRVQRMNRNDSMGHTQKVEELLKWDRQNRIIVEFTYESKSIPVIVYLNEINEKNETRRAFVKMGEGLNDEEMKLNSPMGIWVPNRDAGQTLVMVLTWIGDVFND